MTLGNVEPGSLRCFAEPLMKESTADGQAEKVGDLEHAFVARRRSAINQRGWPYSQSRYKMKTPAGAAGKSEAIAFEKFSSR